MASAIEDIIDELEDYIDSCKPAAFSSTKIVVNRDDIDGLLEELRAKTPEEIRRYQKIISNKEAILADAKAKADAIVAEAQITKNELISEHQIMQQAYAQANEVIQIATKEAQEVLDNATRDANSIRTGAIAYTDELLKTIYDIVKGSVDTTRARDEAFLNTMQGYLDVIIENRNELAPEPEKPAEKPVEKPEIPASVASSQDADKDAEDKSEEKKDEAAEPAKEPEKKEIKATEVLAKKNSDQTVLNIPDDFFNKN